jgi:tetratricopeptide (TPR) repeat protein
LRVQADWRREQYYRDLDQRLKLLDPESVGVESLVEARLNATRGSAHGGLAGEMRAVRRLVSDLNSMENAQSPKDGWKTRKRAREYVARRLEPVIESAARRGDFEAALEGSRAVEDTGVMSSRMLRNYGDLLNGLAQAADVGALRVYIRCLESYNWRTSGDQLLEQFRTRLSDALRIHEQMPHQEIKQRLPLIARMQAGGGELDDSAKNLGLGYLMLDQPEKALVHLERACKMDGHDRGETHFYLAQSLYRTQKFEQASHAFDEALRRGYPQSRIAAWQGLSLAKNGKWDAAYELFNRAEETLGMNADSTFYLFWARASYRMNAVEEAGLRFVKAMEKSLGKEPRGPSEVFDCARARHGLAICLWHDGQTSQAIELLQEGIRMREEFAPASHLLGRLLEQQGRIAEALPHYRAATELNGGDNVYKLSLGLALDTTGSSGALPILLEVHGAGNGSVEIARRLAAGYCRKGESAKSRQWFDHLAHQEPDNMEFVRWSARYTASEATEAFQSGDFGQAARLWESVSRVWSEPIILTRLGQALLCDASARLKAEWERGLDRVWPQIQRAHQLVPCWESRYLNAVASLVQGDYDASQAEFAALDDGAGDRSVARLLEALARYLGGDEEALSDLSEAAQTGGMQSLGVLIVLLQIQSAARKGEFELAVQRIEEWLRLPDFMVIARLNRGQINSLLWMCINRLLRARGVRQRTRIQNLLASLKQTDESFWAPAIEVGQVALELANKKPGEVEVERLERSQLSLFNALETLAEADRCGLKMEIERFLRFRIQDSILRGNLVMTTSLVDQLNQLAGRETPEAAQLSALVAERLENPSHEKAFALVESNPDQARAIWLQRLERTPGEHASIEHLATLAWTRAYDLGQQASRAVETARETKDGSQRKQLETEIARDFDAAIAYFAEGLEYFRQIYSDDSYWEALRQKGRKVANARNPFSEGDFDTWRASALQAQAQTLVNFASYVADFDPKNGVARARSAVARLRSCGLPEKVVESLVDTFAQTNLGTDPTTIPTDQFDATMARAERLLKIDEQNIQALWFIVRGYTYWSESSDLDDAGMLADRMGAVRNRAERLEKLLVEASDTRRQRMIGDLASYYEALGMKMSRKANALVGELNAAPGFPPTIIRNLRSAIEASNGALREAIRLDKTIALRSLVTDAQKLNQRWLDQLRNL